MTISETVQLLLSYIRAIFGFSIYATATEIEVRKRVQQLLDYYKGTQFGYLQKVLDRQFSNPSALKMQLSISNVVRYITDTLANTFKHGLIVDAVNESDQPIYDEIVETANLDLVLQNLERNLFLCKTVFVKVSWRDEGIKLDVITPQFVMVDQKKDDTLSFESVVYPKVIKGYNGFYPEGEFHRWTPTEYSVVTDKGITVQNPDNVSNVNPYGIVPIVVFREYLPTDSEFFATPGEELISAQDTLNVLLTELNQLVKMQSFSVPVLKNPARDQYGNVTILIDPSKPIVIDSDKDKQGDFQFVSPNAKIAEVQDAIDSCYLRTFSFYGVSPAEFVRSSERMSGESIKELHSRIDEYRQNMKTVLMPQLKNLFDVIRIVYNTHATAQQLSEDGVTLTIQTSKLSYGSVGDKWTDYEKKLNLNLMTVPQIAVLEQDDLNDASAKAMIDENKEVNAIYYKPTSVEKEVPTQEVDASQEETESEDLNNG